MGSKPPKPPDPQETAQAQALANREAVRESALMNQIGINSPYGRQYYTGAIGSPDRTLNIELTPGGEQTRQSQEDLAALLSGYGAETLGPAALERLSGGPSQAGDLIYERGLRRLEPEYDESQALLESRLMSQGIPVGSRAYEQAMGQFGRQRADAMENLALSSEIAGLGEDRAQRSQAINELSALLQGAPAIGSPVTSSPGAYNVAAPDIAGLTAQNYAAEQANAARNAQTMGTLATIAGGVGGFFLGGPVGAAVGGGGAFL